MPPDRQSEELFARVYQRAHAEDFGDEQASLEDVQAQANSLAQSVLRDQQLLGSLLDRHEAVLRKRWQKKSPEKKRQVLLAAWGSKMAPSHRPEVKHCFRHRRNYPDHRLTYLCPNVNQEDLCHPKHFLMMLHSRARTSPSEFAALDADALNFGRLSAAFGLTKLPGYYMHLSDVSTPANYSELHNLDSRSALLKMFFSPEQGLLVLESQQKTLTFLVSCVELILHDIKPSQLLDSPVQPLLDQIVGSNDHGFPSLWSLAGEAPYLCPSQLDFTSTVAVLNGRATAAEDHMWSMREDPSYFANALFTQKDHREENLRDELDQEYHTLRNIAAVPFGFWRSTIGEEVNFAYLNLEYWRDLSRQASALHRLQQDGACSGLSCEIAQDGESDEDASPLVKDSFLAMAHFVEDLRLWALVMSGTIWLRFTASPSWRVFYSRDSPDTWGAVKSELNERRLTREHEGVQEFDWLVGWLYRHVNGSNSDDNTFFLIVDELQHLMNTDPKVQQRLTSSIADLLSDLFLVVALIRQITAFPGYRTILPAMEAAKGHEIARNRDSVRAALEQVQKVLQQHGSDALAEAMPIDQRFLYPSGQRRNRNNTELMRRAEANLDSVWAKLDAVMFEHIVGIEQSALRDLMQGSRPMRRTVEWTESLPETISTQPDASHDAEQPESTSFWHLQDTAPFSTKRGKTPRGSSKAASSDHQDQSSDEDLAAGEKEATTDTPNAVLYEVTPRAREVFATLFYTPSAETPASGRELPWTDFLHAMASVGFAAEQLYGSAWQFLPPIQDGKPKQDKGRIIFHQPHPGNKLSFWKARNYGRRLNRAYGWDARNFGVKGRANGQDGAQGGSGKDGC